SAHCSTLLRPPPPCPPRRSSDLFDDLGRAGRRGTGYRRAAPVRTTVFGCARRRLLSGFAVRVPHHAAARKKPAASTPENGRPDRDRKSTRLNSSHQITSYAVFCL